jgi:hypothetical protein
LGVLGCPFYTHSTFGFCGGDGFGHRKKPTMKIRGPDMKGHRHAHPGKTPATDFGVFLGCISCIKIPILGEKWAINSLKFVED